MEHRHVTDRLTDEQKRAGCRQRKVEEAWADELRVRIERADAHPEDGIPWTDLRTQLLPRKRKP